ncbi:neuromedin-S [Tautogolabrus adspersus]
MTLPTVRQFFLLCFLWFLGSWSTADSRPFNGWDDGITFRKVRGIQSGDYSDVLWGQQNEEQAQNVFKRFLFHYSKARNSVSPLQQVESHSVHPLMRLSPKLSKRKNKKILLLIRGLPEGML